MKSFSIGGRLLIAAALSSVLTLGLGAFCLREISRIHREIDSLVTVSLPASERTAEISKRVAELPADRWRHIATRSATEKRKVEALIEKSDAGLRTALQQHEQAGGGAQDRAAVAQMTQSQDRFAKAWQKIRPYSRARWTRTATGQYVKEAAPAHTALSGAAAALEQQAREEAVMDARVARETLVGAKTRLGMLLILCGVLGTGLFGLIVWSIRRTLHSAAKSFTTTALQVASAAGQVTSASRFLMVGSTEQSAVVRETSAAAREVAVVSRQNARDTREASGMMKCSQQSAARIQSALTDLTASMQQIDTSSSRISNVIRVMDRMAFHTNILALNAAVEAAKAGEAGAGFAVVAEEVRNLAQRSAEVARDTATLIESAVSDTSTASRKVRDVVAALKQNAEIGFRVTAVIDRISAGSQDQAAGIDQISQVMARVQQASQEAAAYAGQSAAAGEQLAAQAAAMQVLVKHIDSAGGSERKGRRRKRDKAKAARQAEQLLPATAASEPETLAAV